MTQIAALPVGHITGSDLTEDGKYLLLKTKQEDGHEVALAVKREELLSLVDMAAFGFTQGSKAMHVSPTLKTVFDVSWWEISFEKDTKRTILSLTFGAGGRLDFRLGATMPEQILETLQAHLAPLAPRQAGKPLN